MTKISRMNPAGDLPAESFLDVEKIEILGVDLLALNRSTVDEFKQLSAELGIGLGWHYLVDFAWIASQLSIRPGMRVLDGGAGVGLLQWWLARYAVDVISVDAADRSRMGPVFHSRFRIKGLRSEDLVPLRNPRLRDYLPPRSPLRWHTYPQKLREALQYRRLKSETSKSSGTVFIYNQDLSSMADIPDNSLDAAVSVSALEHNSVERLPLCVREIMRTLKPGGKLIATLPAAKDQDWYHKPSNGWCYTEKSLRALFDLPQNCISNYDQYDSLFEALKGCAELRDNLAPMYFKSENNGMPGGVWQPQYQPVGIIKIKSSPHLRRKL